ncbi:hypothetical protein KAH55_07700 [bacterium]|nr:hypothetical protein [bacterium]
MPVGCAFHPRCSHAQTECRQVTQPLIEISPRWQVACNLLKEGAPNAVITQ